MLPQHSTRVHLALVISLSAALFCVAEPTYAQEAGPRWIAGDHHIHSRYSTGWDRDQEPPAPVLGGDAIYPIQMNALMAKYFGLGWMVATDHGGPNHSKVNLNMAYPELERSRLVVPEVVQFWGMEFDTPGADHSSLIIPHSHEESQQLFAIESQFSRREPWPEDASWNTEPRMLEALEFMKTQERAPLLIANHPSRSASALGEYGLYTPSELRNWNDTAPNIAVGMAAAPGHQASALNADGSVGSGRPRGYYRGGKTLGGFDQFTAVLGGFWDSMLGEGRRWWVTANSDSHVHYTEGGADFWPGEYSKTHVWATHDHDSILEGIRNGRVFVTTGDLISALDFSLAANGQSVSLGETLEVAAGSEVALTVRFQDPESPNARGENPSVKRVDVIRGDLTGPVQDRAEDANPTTRVAQRTQSADWHRTGDVLEFTLQFTADKSGYVRLRGTNGDELEPTEDAVNEDPWSDLWFYSNPIFIQVN